MANKFNKGDVVVLKSGGVPMTVDGVPGEVLPGGREREEYRLVWQKGASPQQHAYPEHVLETYVKPANTTLAKK